MTDSASGASVSSTADGDLSAADELLARPFPEREHHDGAGSGGPGFHLRVLQVSRDFWDCPDASVVQQAEAGLQDRLDALEAKLVARWGEPTEVDLWPYLQAGLEGTEVPEPVESLCQLTGHMRVWLIPETGRWLALTIGQGDKELPFEFLIAVGATDTIDPTGSLPERPQSSDGTGTAAQGRWAGPLPFTAEPLPPAVRGVRPEQAVPVAALSDRPNPAAAEPRSEPPSGRRISTTGRLPREGRTGRCPQETARPSARPGPASR